MSRSTECPSCGGTGQTGYLGQHAIYGSSYAGSCTRCAGKGLLLDMPVSVGTYSFRAPDGLRYASEAEYREAQEEYRRQDAEDRAAAADRLDWIEAHQHYL